MPLVTQAEYARIRGCSDAAVSTARREGRIKAAEVIKDGKLLIDSDKATQLWAINTKKRRGGTQAKSSPPPEPKPSSQPETAPSPPLSMPTDSQLLDLVMRLPEDAIPPIIDSEARKEHYLAEKHKIAALQARGEVGSIEAMKREAFQLAKAVREGLLGIIPRVSADLAALADPFEIERLLETEMLTALRSLSDG